MNGARSFLRDGHLTLTGRLVSELRRLIVAGDLAPGAHLKERELCERFDISRSILREAVQQLLSEGLLISVPPQGLDRDHDR